MTTLDQAFIKAFQQPDMASATREPAHLMTLSDALRDGPREGVAEEDSVLPEDTPTAPAKDESFRAMLQVDGFGWPKVCTDMHPVAEGQLDCLAARLLGNDASSRAVVGIAGCEAGMGCTTVLLGVARRLARRGLNLVLLDANLANPGLASRLGLLPEVGWETVAAEQLPLAEVLIESIEDRLTLLPLCDPQPLCNADEAEAFSTEMRRAVQALRLHYDLVLVDLGVPGASEVGAGWAADWLDAAVLVHDVRNASPTALAQARSRLEAAGVTVAGVAENYVPLDEASTLRDVA